MPKKKVYKKRFAAPKFVANATELENRNTEMDAQKAARRGRRIAAGCDDEDLKDSYLYNFVLYEAIRMRSETFQYLNPKDAYRTIKSPSAALSTVSRVARFTGQIVPWEITETYKRKQGIWEKGDNKAWAYFVKMIGLPGYNISPREAVKVYESLTSI